MKLDIRKQIENKLKELDTVTEYLDEQHLYLYKGQLAPSVTTMIRLLKQFNDLYLNIPTEVLEVAKERGNAVHKIIQDYEEIGTEDLEDAELNSWLLDYKFLKRMYKFEVIISEIPVYIEMDGKVEGAGRLDLLVFNEKGQLGILDIKSTSSLNKEYLAYQLNAYRIGAEQTYDLKIEFLASLWLYKGKRKYQEIPINEKLLVEMIENKNKKQGENEWKNYWVYKPKLI